MANSMRPIRRASGKCERKGGDALGPLAVANMGEPISATDFRVAHCVRMTEMDAAKIRMDTGFALQSHVIRSTCAAFENLHKTLSLRSKRYLCQLSRRYGTMWPTTTASARGHLGNSPEPISGTWKRRWPPHKSSNAGALRYQGARQDDARLRTETAQRGMTGLFRQLAKCSSPARAPGGERGGAACQSLASGRRSRSSGRHI